MRPTTQTTLLAAGNAALFAVALFGLPGCFVPRSADQYVDCLKFDGTATLKIMAAEGPMTDPVTLEVSTNNLDFITGADGTILSLKGCVPEGETSGAENDARAIWRAVIE